MAQMEDIRRENAEVKWESTKVKKVVDEAL